jgi:predicted TIM-barrel fold metal-dependent hydrolase
MLRSQEPPSNFQVPADACDCHTHIFGDSQRFPFWSGRTYTPEIATVDETRAPHHALQIERIVIVNSLVYGTEDSRMVDALRQLGHRVLGMPSSTTKHWTPNWICWRMRVVCGIRLNFVDLAVPDPEIGRQRFHAAVKCVVARGWHIQIYSRLAVIEALQEDVMPTPVSVVFDHFAGAQASLGVF